ncbi:MAG TPA: RNA methyltransferase [Actinomycetota bacterium]|nr:RNA methyltransferase [Actinomycetota bacterium]
MRALRSHKTREAEGCFFVEGIAPVWHALDSSFEVETILVAPDLLTSPGAAERVAQIGSGHVEIVETTAAAFESISSRDNPQGLGAVVRAQTSSLREVDPTPFAVGVHGVGNPGNLGTVIRTAVAFGGGGVIIAGSGTDPWHPECVKASMGGVFRTPLVRLTDPKDALDWAEEGGISTVATSEHGSTGLKKAALRSPCVLWLGSEALGLPAEILEQADESVRIETGGAISSLNVATAAAIFIHAVAGRLAADQT